MDEPRRSTVDAAGQQVGEQHVSAAGRDIRHGADADAVLSFLREYVVAADQQRETTLKDVQRELKRTRDDMGIISDAVRSVRDRLDDDDRERVTRQAALDKALARLEARASAHAAELAALRRASITGGLVLLGILAVVAILVSREAGWLARAVYDAYVVARP